MAKMFNYVILLVGLSIFLGLGGLDTGAGRLLDLISYNNPSGFSLANLFLGAITVFTASIGASAGGIIIGYLATNNTESALKAGFVTLITTAAVSDMISLIVYFKAIEVSWVGYIISTLFFVLIAGFVMSAIEWWGGTG